MKESQFIAGAGGFCEGGERYAHGRFGKFEAAGHFRITDHLQDAGDEGAQALTGNDVFLELAFEVAGHALGNVGGEPPPLVARLLGGLGHSPLEPGALVFDSALVSEADEREVIGEGDQWS